MAKRRTVTATKGSKQQKAKGKWRRAESRWQLAEWMHLPIPVLALCALLIVLPFIGGMNDLLWTGVLLAVILLAGVAVLSWRVWKRQALELSWTEIFLLAFVAWQWLTLAVSVYRWATLTEATRWTAFAVVFMVVRRLSNDERNSLWLAIAFAVGATLTAVQGLYDYAVNFAMGNPAWRIFGPFLNPNLFANFLLIAFFIALSIAFIRPRNWVVLPAFVAGMLLIALGLTGSKGALLAWLIGIFAFGVLALVGHWQVSSRLTGRWVLILLGGMVIAVAIALLLPPIKARFETMLTIQIHSWMFRFLVWEATLLGAMAKPLLGFGGGTFEWAYPQFTDVGFTRHAHSGFLQIAMESGFVSLAFLLAFFITVGVHGSVTDRWQGWLRIGCLSAVLAFCMHNLVETAWLTTANLLALAFVAGVTTTDAPSCCSFPSRHLPLVIRYSLLIFLLPLLVGIWHSVNIAQGAYFVWQGRNEFSPSSRLYWLERASDADLLNARHKIDQAILLEAWAQVTNDDFRMREALSLCEEAIHLQPTRSGNYKVKARLMQALGKRREAEKALRTALRFNRTDTEAMLKLGELLEKHGQSKDAAQIYQQLVKLERSSYGRYKPVEQWHDPFIAAGKVRLAKWLLKQGQREEALQMLKEAEATLKSFLQDYLPIVKVSDPEVAESQEVFVKSVLEEAKEGRRQKGRKR